MACQTLPMESAGSSQAKHRSIFLFFTLCSVVFISHANIAESKAATPVKLQKIRSIEVNQSDSTGCYKWTDEVKLDEKMNSAKPAIYKAKVASKAPCKEIHHFEIFVTIPKTVYAKTASRESNIGKYCSKVFQEKNRYSVISDPEILPLLMSNNSGLKKYWCSVTGLTYKDSVNNSLLHFEANYFPEFKINTRS